MSCRLVKRYCGGSSSFNGTTSTIPTDITANTAFTSGFVLHGWIKPRSQGENSLGYIFDKSTADTSAGGITLGIGGTNHRVFMRINTGSYTNSQSSSVPFRNWSHVIVHVSSNGNINFYINGALSGTANQTSGALSGITTVNPLTIGNRSTATDRTFDGNLAELGIISLAGRGDLTPAEISQLYTNSVKPTGNAHFFPLSDLPSTYLDTVGGATGTGTATTYSPDVPTQLPVALDTEARSSLSFDGVDDYVNLGNPALDFSNGITIAAWFKIIKKGSSSEIIQKRSGANNRFGLTVGSNNRLYFTVSNGTTSFDRFSTVDVTNGEWVFGVGTFDNVTSSLYIKGILNNANTYSGPLPTISHDTYIGVRDSTLVNDFDGIIDKPRIWNRALTATEIQNLYFNNIVPQDGLVAEYLFNEGAGTIAYDSSGNGNDGTITGATWSADVPSKAREVIGGNLVKNGSFEYVPVVNVATTISDKWIDGTAGGSSLTETGKLFGWLFIAAAGSCAGLFDTTETYNGKPTLKLSTTNTSGRARAWTTGNKTTSPVLTSQRFLLTKLKPSTSYTFTAKIKTLNAVDAYCSIFQYKPDFTTSSTTGQSTNQISGTTDWTTVTVTWTTSADCGWCESILRLNNTAGTVADAWFADISLTETTLPTRTVATTRTTLTCP